MTSPSHSRPPGLPLGGTMLAFLAMTLHAQVIPPASGPDAVRLAELDADVPIQVLQHDGLPPPVSEEAVAARKPPLPRPLVDEPGPGWTGISWSVSANDGLTISGGTFNGRQVVYALSWPAFMWGAYRYELTPDRLVSGPTVRRYLDGSIRVEASYRYIVMVQREPPRFEPIDITQVYVFANRPGQEPGYLKPWIIWSGPAGVYTWFLRCDLDIRGAAGDRYEEFRTQSGRDYWVAGAAESFHGSAAPFWNGYKARTWDESGADREDQTIVAIAPYGPDNATQFVLRYNPGETEDPPSSYLSGETIHTLDNSSLIRNPVAGQDLVWWYETTRSGPSGVVGPDITVGNRVPRRCLVEIDRLAAAAFPPASVSHHECPAVTMEGIYAGLVELEVVRDQTAVPDPHPGSPFTRAELHNLMTANRTYWAFRRDPTRWYVHIVIATRDQEGNYGVMFDWGTYDLDNVAREGCAVFHTTMAQNFTGTTLQKALLRTQAHELGHVFNLEHSDGSIVGSAPWNSCARGYTIMNQTGTISPFPDAILYGFSASSRNKLTTWYDPYVMPGGVPFTTTP